MSQNPRQLAFMALRSVQAGAYADSALDRLLKQSEDLSSRDRSLVTELVYGCVRRRRTLDALIQHYAKQPDRLPPELRILLHLGFYQLVFLDHIPAAAAVNTSVDLAKSNRLGGLSGLVNGLLRAYLRDRRSVESHLPQQELSGPALSGPALSAPDFPSNDCSDRAQAQAAPDLSESAAIAARLAPLGQDLPLGVRHSYPDWIVQVWLDQFGPEATEHLCEVLNQPPHIDLRVNTQRSSVAEVEAAMAAADIATQRIAHLPQALRLAPGAGAIQTLPGFRQGWWVVQDASAQLVGYLLDPQPGQFVVDACAAPGGKTLHLAELMMGGPQASPTTAFPTHDSCQGQLWACDRTPSRLRKIQQNAARLGVQSITIQAGDSRDQPQFIGRCDRVLVDAPCSGLGTLHRHADARWRQTPESVAELAALQQELLNQAATWLKPNGRLVYATCTLHPQENEQLVQAFLHHHPDWEISPAPVGSAPAAFSSPQGWIKVLPQQHGMDGFFMVCLVRRVS